MPAAERLALLNLASDILARSYAGYQNVLAVHAEGSLEAEKLMIWRSYDPAQALELARRFAGIADGGLGAGDGPKGRTGLVVA